MSTTVILKTKKLTKLCQKSIFLVSDFLNNDTFSKDFTAMQVLGMCLPYLKRYFQPYKWNVCLFRAQITQILLFLLLLKLLRFWVISKKNCGLGEIKSHSLTTTAFQKSFCCERFRYMSTLRKKVISAAPLKLISFSA